MNRDLTAGIAVAGAMLALAYGAKWAGHQGYIDGDMVTRVAVGLNGLIIAWFGNRIPKAIAPSGCALRAKRVAGWSMVLSGLAYTALWMFAPISFALPAGSGVIVAGIAVTVFYCLSLRGRRKAA